MSKRCHWCGQFIAADTPPWTFLNRLGEPVTQLHCPGCRASCRGWLWRNLLLRSWIGLP